jgi:hypothetical protein
MSFELIDEKYGKVHYAPKPERISYPLPDYKSIPGNPLSEAQDSQHFLDLSCFAEKWWREYDDPDSDGEPRVDPSAAPWRPIWPARQVELNEDVLNPDWHYAGENQICLVCDASLAEPFTLCDACGEALSRLYLQRYGTDLQHPSPDEDRDEAL